MKEEEAWAAPWEAEKGKVVVEEERENQEEAMVLAQLASRPPC